LGNNFQSVLAGVSWWVEVEGCQRAPPRQAFPRSNRQRWSRQGARRRSRRRALPKRPTKNKRAPSSPTVMTAWTR